MRDPGKFHWPIPKKAGQVPHLLCGKSIHCYRRRESQRSRPTLNSDDVGVGFQWGGAWRKGCQAGGTEAGL